MAIFYNKDKLPFDFTPHIFRYLETLIDVAENTWADETGDEISIDNYLLGEPKNPEIQINNSTFWHFLERIGTIKISEERGMQGLKPGMKVEIDVVENGGIKNFYLPKTYLRIFDTEKLKGLLTERNEGAVIRAETLELLARDIAEYKTGPKIIDLLKRCGVPTKMIVYPNTKWRTLLGAFRVLSTSANPKANRILYKVIEAVIHPLFFDGDKNKATETLEKYNEWLKYDRITIKGGKIHIGPTEEEYELGINDWIDSDGEVVEPKVYSLYPGHIEQLWVLWSQLVVLVHAYEKNQSLDHKELEKLYLEVVGEVEELVRQGKIGQLQEKYTRPFTSLATAHIEAKAKKVESPSDLVNAFLLEITVQKPDPVEVGKEIEKKAELIRRIANATKAISGEEKKQDGNQKILDTLEDTIIRGLKGISFGSQNQRDQQAVQKIEIINKEFVVRNAENNNLQKGKKRESPIELSLPEPVKWEKVTLKIKEGRQDVEIFYDTSHIITANYKQLRFFVGKRQQKPDQQWGFLCALSTLSADNFQHATAENMRTMITTGKILSANSVQQAKKSLVERLQDIFKTHDDPFRDRRDYYEPKFTILPEPVLRRKEIWPQGGKLNENRGDETDRQAYENKRAQEENEEAL